MTFAFIFHLPFVTYVDRVGCNVLKDSFGESMELRGTETLEAIASAAGALRSVPLFDRVESLKARFTLLTIIVIKWHTLFTLLSLFVRSSVETDVAVPRSQSRQVPGEAASSDHRTAHHENCSTSTSSTRPGQ